MQRQDSFCANPPNLSCLLGFPVWENSELKVSTSCPFYVDQTYLMHTHSLSSQWVLFNFNKPLPLFFSVILRSKYDSVSGIFVHTYLPCRSTTVVDKAHQPPGICYELLRVWLILGSVWIYIFTPRFRLKPMLVRINLSCVVVLAANHSTYMCPWSTCLNVRRN